jgi:hypothetical protein
MILILFVILLAISLILVGLGYFTKEGTYYMLGFAFIFILGTFVILPGSLEVPSGSNTTATYTYDGINIANITTIETPTYTSMDSFLTHFFGFWISMLGIVGFIISLGDIKRGVPKYE